MQNKNLGSVKLTELERVRRIISVKQKSLNTLMIEICQLREQERELTPITQALEKTSPEGTANELTPAELPFEATRIYQQG